jgi:hypothetical protein
MRDPFGRCFFLAILSVGCDGSVASTNPGGAMPMPDASGSSDALPATDGAPSNPDGAGPPGGFVDPMCTDGMYTEMLPDPNASLAGVPFSGGDIPAFVDAALMRRYPFGLEVVRGGRMNTTFGDCSVQFAGNPTSADVAYSRLPTIVHECGHLYDGVLSNPPVNAYVIKTDFRIQCSRGDATNRGGDTFARSRIRSDEFQSLRPPCSGTGGGQGCDAYANIYLDGNPDDGTFQGGDQGFNMLLEEAVQYVNSLVTAYAYADRMQGSTSARDGILTMLWYVERYLHLARTTYPTAYTRLSGDECWRTAILTMWGRAWLYLQLTRDDRRLGIDDAAIKALVADPALLDEIQRIRTAAGCP